MGRCTFHSVVTTKGWGPWELAWLTLDTDTDQGRSSVPDVGQGRGLAPPPELPDQAPAGDAVLVRNCPGHVHLKPSCSTRRDMTLNLPTDPDFFEQIFNVLDPVRIPKNAPRKNHEYSRVRYLNWLNIFERKCLKLFLFLTSFVGNLKLLSNAWLIFSIQRLLQQIFGKNRSL